MSRYSLPNWREHSRFSGFAATAVRPLLEARKAIEQQVGDLTMPGGGSKPGERRGGRKRGTPNKTLTEQAQALAAKLAKAEARANAKLVALAHAIQATVAESQGLPGASARERFNELVWNALVAEKLAPKEIAPEPENTSIVEPAAALDDADGILVEVVRGEFES